MKSKEKKIGYNGKKTGILNILHNLVGEKKTVFGTRNVNSKFVYNFYDFQLFSGAIHAREFLHF